MPQSKRPHLRGSVLRRSSPEVLGGELAAEEDGRVLADGLLDDPGALSDARDYLERAVTHLLHILLIPPSLQEPA